MRAALIAGLALALAPDVARAERLARGVSQPGASLASEDHAEAAATNPAGLGFGGDFDLTLTAMDAARDRSGEGLAAHFALGLLDPWHTALGVELLEAPGRQTAEPVKVTWANSVRFSDRFALGLAWHTFAADADPALRSLSTLDLGVSLRPWRALSLGVVATDVATPLVQGAPLPRGWEFGLALRPWTDRVTLGGVARVVERGHEAASLGARLEAALWGGLGLEGRWDTQPDGADRRHQFFFGLTQQLGGPVNVGLYGYRPDMPGTPSAWGLGARVRASSQPEAEPRRTHRTPRVLEVVLQGSMAELAPGGLFSSTPKAPFLQALELLRRAELDPGVDAVLLALVDPGFGWAQAQELRRRVEAVRRAGKVVYAWTAVGDTRAYFVASAAEKVFTAPSGGLLVTGVKAELTYLRPLLDRLGAQPEFIAVGAYKSAPEMFTHAGPTEPAREAENALLDGIYAQLIDGIARSRGQTPEVVRAWIDDAPHDAQRARASGLVDAVIQYDEFEGEFERRFGQRAAFIQPDALESRTSGRWGARPQIAVLFAVGTITDGESVSNPFTGSLSTGADTFLKAARALREDDSVKAVVLRIDSPGGSVTASDAMWRELTLLAKDKPLIVSMGDVAASGGYYIAVPGAEIFAEANTITGSIGVFTGKADLSGLLRWIGVHTETFVRGARADLLTLSRSWTDDEVAALRASMEALYGLFLDRVTASRPRLPRATLEQVAQGRVWTGADARAHGLVDREAGLAEAIERATELARLDRDDIAIKVAPTGSGLSALPRSPVLSRLVEALSQGQASALATHLPAPLRQMLDLPLAHFQAGEPLVMLPFVFSP